MTLFEMKFTTWENDADDYATVTHFLTTKEDVNFYTELAKKFVSCNSRGNGMGNEDCEGEDIDYLIQDLMESHPDISPAMKEEWTSLIGQEYGTYDKLCEEILSEPVQYDYGFCRVLESINVEEMKSGAWIEVNGNKAVFKDFQDNQIVYYYSDYAKDTNGEVDIFKLEWKTGMCDLSAFTTLGKADKVSLKVIQIV